MAVLSLSDAKLHLNITTSGDDAELSGFIDAAVAAIAQKVGPLEATATTVRVRGCSEALALPVIPTVSLTSVTPVGGSALTLGDLRLDTTSGVVTYNLGGTFGASFYDVVYEAGRSTVPADLLMAVKELVKHMWTTQRGGSKRPGTGGGDSYSNTIPGAAYAFPFRVEQLIAPHLQAGFA